MDAPKPFDTSAYSDVILRSSDNVDFFVLESLLRLVSPIFNSMLSSDQKSFLKEKRNGLPILPVADDSTTLYSLLSIIYPYVHKPKLNDSRLLLKVGMASRIYQMETIENKLKMPLSSTVAGCGVGVYPHQFQLFATLVQLGWHQEATLAAKNTLSMSLRELPYVKELREINGADFFGYLALRSRCERAVGQKDSVSKTDSAIRRLSIISQQQQSDTETLISGRAGGEKLFEPSKKADVILRSSDSVDFFVLKALLSLVSPVFEKKKPTTKATGENGLPIFELEEDSDTLRQLLLLVYPHGVEYQVDKLDRYLKLGKAAQKYKMFTIEEKLKQQLLGACSSLLTTDSTYAFTISVILGWGDVAKVAAMNSLKEPLEDMPYVEEMKQITGADLYWLVQYRAQCVDAACEVIEMEPIFATELHKKGADNSTVKSRILDKLKVCPRGSGVVECYAGELEELEKGVYWDLKVMLRLLKKRDALVKTIEEAVAKVPLRVECCKDPQAENDSPKKNRNKSDDEHHEC